MDSHEQYTHPDDLPDCIYMVTIQAKVRKTLQIIAKDEAEAREIAYETFTTECDGDEDYQEDILDVQEVG